MVNPRQTSLRLLFTKSGTDVTEDVVPDLLSFTYEDQETGRADGIRLLLKDETGRWAGSWKPQGGEIIDAYLAAGDVTGQEREEIFCGRFYADLLRVSGAPRTFELQAISIPLNQPIRRRLITKAWESRTLKGIAQEIADSVGMQLFYDVQEDPQYDRRDQKQESNLSFLNRLCEDEGFSLKVTDDRIVIFDQASYEKKEPIKTIVLGESNVLSWSFESQQSDTYKSCTVAWRDPRKKSRSSAGGYNLDLEKPGGDTPQYDENLNRIERAQRNPAVSYFTYTDPEIGEEGQEYKLKKRATSKAEAERLARATLRRLNLRKVTGCLTLIGDPALLSGSVIEVRGFGSFDGRFIIQSASHDVSSSGYTTNLSLRRVNANY